MTIAVDMGRKATKIKQKKGPLVKIDHKIISRTILLPSAVSRRVVVILSERMCMNY